MHGKIWIDKIKSKQLIDNKYDTLLHFTIKLNIPDSQSIKKQNKIDITQFRGSSILIIESDKQYITSLINIAVNLKMEPLLVNNIQEASHELDRARQNDKLPALILLDTNITGKDFSQFIKNCKRINIPTILLAKDQKQKKLLQSKKIEVHSIISKPIKPTEVVYEIYNLLASTKKKSDGVKSIREIRDRSRKYNYKILIAEDNLVNKKLIIRLMEKLGHQVTAVENGNEVLSAFKNNKYDLILMDLQMPEMDGIKTTQKIRDIEKDKKEHTAIIALTAHAMEEDKQRCISSGMDGYISKPVKINELLETIDTILYNQTIFQ